MVIKQARHKRTEHKVVALERLVDRRRLVDTSRDGFEVRNIEDPWVQITIPSHDIKWMVIKDMTCQPIPDFDPDFERAAFGMCFQNGRRPEIALGVRGVFEQLTVIISIAAAGVSCGSSVPR